MQIGKRSDNGRRADKHVSSGHYILLVGSSYPDSCIIGADTYRHVGATSYRKLAYRVCAITVKPNTAASFYIFDSKLHLRD